MWLAVRCNARWVIGFVSRQRRMNSTAAGVMQSVYAALSWRFNAGILLLRRYAAGLLGITFSSPPIS